MKDGSPVVLIGRAPAGTASVRLVFGDGGTEAANVGHGLWIAWLATPATPVVIEALDVSGAVVGRIADPAGIEPAGGSIVRP